MIKRELIAAAEKHLARQCPQMRRLIRTHGPCTFGERRRDPFDVLASSIISQQLSTKAANTIQGRVHALVGARTRLLPAQVLAASPEDLRACGLSNAKVKWLIEIARRVDSGELDFRKVARMDDASALVELDALPGVGLWTAEMFLMFAMNRLDVFSLGDVGLRNGVNRLFNAGGKLDEHATLEVVGRWTPYRSVASWYLWRVADADL
ncbi:MAG: DNA-3-methyladenine glycosylase 2 family protein [Panacagrimonas sp.]|jgi:DNA-3-methyladenine glycosylase II|nr:DNA-3-methyladenine glycosylase 2 family protein [Panacagrimonas sp.]MCC2655651.1 DNA-3-methyladenine glycosylase 2 family protein [Panacagrimonas sp.]